MDWIFALPTVPLKLSPAGWINVGFVAVILIIAAVGAILGRVARTAMPRSMLR